MSGGYVARGLARLTALSPARRPIPLSRGPIRILRVAACLVAQYFLRPTRLACLLCDRRAFSKCELPHTPRPIPERCWRAWADGTVHLGNVGLPRGDPGCGGNMILAQLSDPHIVA